MSNCQQFACLIEVWGLIPGPLPAAFGATTFIVRGDGEFDAMARLVGASINDRQEETHDADVRRTLASRQTHATAAIHCVDASEFALALALAEEEIELTIDCMNFFSDLTAYIQSPLSIRLHESPAHSELRAAVAEDGNCFNLSGHGRPRNFSVKALHDTTGIVREAIDRVEALLQNPERTEVQERLLRAVRWSGRATAERTSDKQLLFAMIALECIVKPFPIKYVKRTVARRAARLLSLTDADQGVLQDALKDLYAQRSEVAHVGAVDVSRLKEGQLQSRMRRLTKSAILTLLTDPEVNNYASLSQLADHLDHQSTSSSIS